MTSDGQRRVDQFTAINDELWHTLENTFSFNDAAFIYAWKWTLLATLVEWAAKVAELNHIGDTTGDPPCPV